MPFLQEYTMLDELGKGGFATVYKVRHNELGYIRAIRVLNETVVDASSKTYQKFLRECKVLLRLGNGSHPNIVHIYQPRLLENKALVEMDYVDGQDIMHYLKQNQNFVPVEEVVRMALQMSSALAYCHEDIYRFCMDREVDNLRDDPDDGSKVLMDEKIRQRLIAKYKIIHNDIHSGNIMRREDGNFVLLDFGLAINGEEVVRSSRHTNGAPEFKAPEKWDNEAILSEQSDIYSFGIVMYQYLAGQVPFPYNDQISNHKAQFELAEAHQKAALPSIKTLRKEFFEKKFNGLEYKTDYPKWLEDVILKCLQKNPNNRFKNGKELYDFITKYAGEKARVSDEMGVKWEQLTQELNVQIEELRSVKESLQQQVEQLTSKITKQSEIQMSAKISEQKAETDTKRFPVEQPIDGALLHIIEEASHEDSILAAYKAQKRCCQICKTYHPDYKKYVEHLQLQKYPSEYHKSLIGQSFRRLLIWCIPPCVICFVLSVLFWAICIDSTEDFGWAALGTTPVFIGLLCLILIERKKVKKKIKFEEML